MRTVRYVGPAPEVMIAATGQVVAYDTTVDIEDDDLAESLCQQADNWQAEGWQPPQPPSPDEDGDEVTSSDDASLPDSS